METSAAMAGPVKARSTIWEDYTVTQLKKALVLGAAALALMAGTASAADLACLITKNNTNPFFVKMKEGAEKAATAAGLDFQAYAGVVDRKSVV